MAIKSPWNADPENKSMAGMASRYMSNRKLHKIEHLEGSLVEVSRIQLFLSESRITGRPYSRPFKGFQWTCTNPNVH